jgi:hypothetical protein
MNAPVLVTLPMVAAFVPIHVFGGRLTLPTA